MISPEGYKKVQIHITLNRKHPELKDVEAMNDLRAKNCRQVPSKFICSICLNTKLTDDKNGIESEKRKTTSCPVCKKSDDTQTVFRKKEPKKDIDPKCKVVQTSETDVTQGLNLLNEVLTVFQSKKQIEQKVLKTVKTVIFKDASVATDFYVKVADLRPKLSVSKIYHLSIEENINRDNNKFMVVNSCQPDVVTKSLHSTNLTKRKSSSIPQMKMEELKNSLKEKTKSKDAIEEVNRMFATVRRNDRESVDDTNRPMVRHGPRVLPVVKTCGNFIKQETSDENDDMCRKRSCKCCQTNNYIMSSGDSSRDIECHHSKNEREKQKCDKCVYMLCCHYDEKRNMQTGVMFCECCGKKSKEFYKRECDKNCVDSATSF